MKPGKIPNKYPAILRRNEKYTFLCYDINTIKYCLGCPTSLAKRVSQGKNLKVFGGILRFKVPQSIDMPDRIVGPLTMIQFVEAVLGGGLAYVLYNSFPSPLNLICSVIVGIFTVAIIFVKINERPFLFYLLALLKFISTPKQRVWQKNSQEGLEVEIYKAQKNTGPQVAHKNLTHEQAVALAKQLDSQSIDKMKMGK